MDQNIKQEATIQIIQEDNQFKVFTSFNPPIPEDRKQEEMSICEAAAMTAIMAVKMWWENINNQEKEAQKEGNNWIP